MKRKKKKEVKKERKEITVFLNSIWRRRTEEELVRWSSVQWSLLVIF